jgi:lipopolysaccharide export LptBFGC system permease protein LptF
MKPPFDLNRLFEISMRIAIFVVLVAGLAVILSGNYSPEAQRWAFGIVSAILGVWLSRRRTT